LTLKPGRFEPKVTDCSERGRLPSQESRIRSYRQDTARQEANVVGFGSS
jgi:hypothetical protein